MAASGTSEPAQPFGWLPEAAEDVAAPEALDDPDEPARAGASLATGPGGEVATRLWYRGDGLAAVLSRRRAGRELGVVVTRSRGSLAAGALAVPGMGLAGERSRLTRAARGALPAEPAREALRPAWGSGADATGIAVAWADPGGRAGRGRRTRFAARLIAGWRARGAASLVAGECRIALDGASPIAIRAARWRERGETEPSAVHGVASVAWSRRRGPARVAAEIARDASGVHADLGVGVRERSFAASATWRRRAAASRPVGLDFRAGWSARAAAARFRWRAWSAAAAGAGRDDGRADVDLRAGRGGPGTIRLRLGTKPRRNDGTAGERLAVADLVAARERGRALRLFTSVRATPSRAGWRYGRALGASLRLERSRRGAIDLRAEAVRAGPGAAAAGSAFEIAGSGSLRSRTRSGVRLAARGWLAAGAWRVGAAVDDEETDGTTKSRAPRARLWITWNQAPGAP